LTEAIRGKVQMLSSSLARTFVVISNRSLFVYVAIFRQSGAFALPGMAGIIAAKQRFVIFSDRLDSDSRISVYALPKPTDDSTERQSRFDKFAKQEKNPIISNRYIESLKF
jgi:hypothetical protein